MQLLTVSVEDILKANYSTNYSLNNHQYEVELYITNSTGKVLLIPPTAIKTLNISETLGSWVVDGNITVNFDNNSVEYADGFIFRNDGEDILRFRIVPLDSPVLNAQGYTSLQITKKAWELNYVFSIHEIQDVSPQTAGNSDSSSVTKLKKFFFRDIRQHIMYTRNMEYTTCKSKYSGFSQGVIPDPTFPPSKYSDENRSTLTNYAIDEIIKNSLNNNPVLSKTAATDTKSTDEWSIGGTKVFYASPATSNAYGDLMYVYSRHVDAETEDPCILSIERGEGDLGYFSLRSLGKYFSQAGSSEPGPFQIEHFFLRNDFQVNDSNGKASISDFRAPILRNVTGQLYNDMVKDIKIEDFNIIDKFEFVDISPDINTAAYTTRPVYSFNFKNRQFNVEFKNNSLEKVENTFTNKYIKHLYKGRSHNSNNYLLKTDTPTKQTNNNSNITPIFSLYGNAEIPTSRLPDGYHGILKTGLFQNTCINFTVPGLTLREPGRFIGIDRLRGSVDNTFDDKLCGQWFVINVEHVFAAGMYYNNITAVKVHRYNPLSYVGDVNTRESTKNTA